MADSGDEPAPSPPYRPPQPDEGGDMDGNAERFETVIVGGGQSGLSVGYHLQRLGRPVVILDPGGCVGDAWRQRWDSLRLFTPAKYDGLDGWRFPARGWSFPTKDGMADYLEAYAARFELPVRHRVGVDGLTREDGRYVLAAGAARFEADHVVIATNPSHTPMVPTFSSELDPGITQLHSAAYRNPAQLRDGSVLVVGAGNSGAEIALEVAATHPTIVAGRAVME